VANLLEHVEQSICERKLLTRGQGILVAVSGGLDSVTLLHLLGELSGEHHWRLTVAHLNHKLRGKASDGDERFVRAIAGRLKLPCVTGVAEVRGLARKQRISVEMAARELRHEFLAGTARKLRISTVALAHHADDQVELFFLRLFRGTGGEGLAGMKWRAPSPADSNVELIRPFLDVSRGDLERFAQEHKIRFREDVSNESSDIMRNRVRCELLPWLRKRFQPGLNKTVFRVMEIVGAESEALSELTRSFFSEKRPKTFSSVPVAIQRRWLQTQLQQHFLPVDFELVEMLRSTPDQPVSVSSRASVSRDRKGRVHLHTHRRAAFNASQLVLKLVGRAGECVFDGVRFEWRKEAVGCHTLPRRRPFLEFFDADRVGSQLLLRHWRAGDRFQPIGLSSEAKLQDWFTNQKISGELRRELIVATTARGEIFWIEGQRIGERFKLTANTKCHLIWRWNRV
jgi:tRNA(Ile)-lysidine synthase